MFVFSVVGVMGCGPRAPLDEEEDTDSGSAGLCGVLPCGGQLVGKWEARAACSPVDLVSNMQATISQPECRNLFSSAPAVTASGTVEFLNTGTTTSTAAVLVDWYLMLTDACAAALVGQTGLKTSDAYCTTYAESVPQLEGHPFASATCRYVSGQGCDCVAKSRYGESSSGTWRIIGDEFTDEEGTRFPYCVTGDTLQFKASDDSGAPGYVMTLKRQ